jgi:hypothetical protein
MQNDVLGIVQGNCSTTHVRQESIHYRHIYNIYISQHNIITYKLGILDTPLHVTRDEYITSRPIMQRGSTYIQSIALQSKKAKTAVSELNTWCLCCLWGRSEEALLKFFIIVLIKSMLDISAVNGNSCICGLPLLATTSAAINSGSIPAGTSTQPYQ